MKAYLLFTYDRYEPMGGIDDLYGDFDNLGDACEAGINRCDRGIHKYDAHGHWHVVEYATLRKVGSSCAEDLDEIAKIKP